MAKKMTDYEIGMIHGCALACSAIQRSHDQPTMIAEAVRAFGLDRAKMKRAGVADYDLKILRPVFAEL